MHTRKWAQQHLVHQLTCRTCGQKRCFQVLSHAPPCLTSVCIIKEYHLKNDTQNRSIQRIVFVGGGLPAIFRTQHDPCSENNDMSESTTQFSEANYPGDEYSAFSGWCIHGRDIRCYSWFAWRVTDVTEFFCSAIASLDSSGIFNDLYINQ